MAAMTMAAMSSPVKNSPLLITLVEPTAFPALVSPMVTAPPLLLAFETPPFPVLAVSVSCADAAPTNAVEAIAAIASPLISFFIGSDSSPLTLCPPLARKRASRPESRRASATPRHAATI
jgi:hypothetical protein